MTSNELAEFRIRVRPSPETNDHEVRLLADGTSLPEQFSDHMMGLDPDDLLIEPCALRADNPSHKALIARCSCGILGCGSVAVKIQRYGGHVIWAALDGSRSVEFDAAQYDAEVERALQDHSWETPDRTAARLISQAVDKPMLARCGFRFSWASARCSDGMMTVSLELRPGPYQILVHLPWNGGDVLGIVREFKTILSQPPELWPNVEWNPQSQGIAPPPITGPGWKS